MKVNHYGDDGDSPDWVSESDASDAGITRYVDGLGGDVLATTSRSGDLRVQVSNLHGDVVVDFDPRGTSTQVDSAFDYDEYGVAKTAASRRYGWLGAHQRSSETPNGVVLMGARLYNPGTGRFLQADPDPSGSPSRYAYPTDPLTQYDLDGYGWWGSFTNWVSQHKVDIALTVLMFVPVVGPVVAVARVARGAHLAHKAYKARKFARAAQAARRARAARYRAAVARRSRARAAARRRARSCNSFVAGTLVLMADGSHKPIELVTYGDLVLAADPVTGETSAQEVVAPIVGEGVKSLVGLTIDADGDGRGEVLTATSEHPIFTSRGPAQWKSADEIGAGEVLQQATQARARVLHVDGPQVFSQRVHNLTVANLHTYFVAVDDGTVLVHNAYCRYAKNYTKSSRTFKTRREALAEAKQTDKRTRGKFRDTCCGHYHVDFFNGRGEVTHTIHFRWRRR